MKIPIGIRYILIATLAFGFMNALAKNLSSYNVFQVVFFRALGTFVIASILLLKEKVPFLGTNRKWLLLRAFTGVLSMVTFFYVLQRIPFGSTTALRYTAPFFAAIFAVIFLKEKINRWQWLCFSLALVGAILLKGFDSRIDLWSLGLILFSAIMSGAVYVIIRYLANREHPLVIVNYFMGMALLTGLIFGWPYWQMPASILDWILLLSLGLFGFFGQLFMTKAFQFEEASIIAPFKYMELLYALILGWLWFDEGYSLIALLGIICILIGMVGNVIVKSRK